MRHPVTIVILLGTAAVLLGAAFIAALVWLALRTPAAPTLPFPGDIADYDLTSTHNRAGFDVQPLPVAGQLYALRHLPEAGYLAAQFHPRFDRDDRPIDPFHLQIHLLDQAGHLAHTLTLKDGYRETFLSDYLITPKGYYTFLHDAEPRRKPYAIDETRIYTADQLVDRVARADIHHRFAFHEQQDQRARDNRWTLHIFKEGDTWSAVYAEHADQEPNKEVDYGTFLVDNSLDYTPLPPERIRFGVTHFQPKTYRARTRAMPGSTTGTSHPARWHGDIYVTVDLQGRPLRYRTTGTQEVDTPSYFRSDQPALRLYDVEPFGYWIADDGDAQYTLKPR